MNNNKNFNLYKFKTGYLDESGDSGETGSNCLDVILVSGRSRVAFPPAKMTPFI